jgi:hypothetical protein
VPSIRHRRPKFWINICPTTRDGNPSGGGRYSSYSFLTSALDGGEWSSSRPGRALPTQKAPPVPIVQEAGWAPDPVWTQRLEETLFAPAEDWTPVVQSVVTILTYEIWCSMWQVLVFVCPSLMFPAGLFLWRVRVIYFLRGEVTTLTAQPPTWRARPLPLQPVFTVPVGPSRLP